MGKAAKTASLCENGESGYIMGWSEPVRVSARMNELNLSDAEIAYLKPGLTQPSGKLPLFDVAGQCVNPKTMRSCIRKGLCEPWFANPMKPDWMVCRLTDKARAIL